MAVAQRRRERKESVNWTLGAIHPHMTFSQYEGNPTVLGVRPRQPILDKKSDISLHDSARRTSFSGEL